LSDEPVQTVQVESQCESAKAQAESVRVLVEFVTNPTFARLGPYPETFALDPEPDERLVRSYENALTAALGAIERYADNLGDR
jgi:hypothetical protein